MLLMSFREGRLTSKMPDEVANYISSLRFDREIYGAVILINAVHLKMLARLGYLSKEALLKALEALRQALERPLALDDPHLEDVHIAVEEYLSERVPEAGQNLALGKSRNDAVSTAIRMRLKERVLKSSSEALQLVESLLDRAEGEAETIFPVYTHGQVAAPATFGFILVAHASRILGGVESMRRSYFVIDECPLGASAVSGTSIKIDREIVAKELGFSSVLTNALEATASRDFLLDVLCSLLRLILPISDLSEELVIYSSKEFGLLDIPDEYCSTSSIMPQKKNPVVAEIARTKLPEVLAEITRVATIISRRFGGYVLDLQQATPSLWRALDSLDSTLSVYKGLVSSISVRREAAYKACNPPAGIVELANMLVERYGLSFREAHRLCGRISRSIFDGRVDERLLEEALSDLGVKEKVNVGEVLRLLEPRNVVNSYRTLGSSNPDEVRRMVSEARRALMELEEWVDARKRELESVAERALSYNY